MFRAVVAQLGRVVTAGVIRPLVPIALAQGKPRTVAEKLGRGDSRRTL